MAKTGYLSRLQRKRSGIFQTRLYDILSNMSYLYRKWNILSHEKCSHCKGRGYDEEKQSIDVDYQRV